MVQHRSNHARLDVEDQDSIADAFSEVAILDESERCIRGVVMPPLLMGEFKLLSYLGANSPTWYSSYKLSVFVYQRDDAAARQLVWKYASTLRKKLALVRPELIELCRRRGYRSRQRLRTVEGGGDSAFAEIAARLTPMQVRLPKR